MTCYYKPKFKVGKTEMDESFLGIAHLYRYATDIIQEYCRRFGAEKAEKLHDSVWCHFNEYGEKNGKKSLCLTIINERGIEPSPGDLSFLIKVYDAERLIENAKQLLMEALHEKED